jgi:hypothetical protein
MRAPSRANAEAFEAAVDDVAVVTARLLDAIVVRTPADGASRKTAQPA